MGRFVYLFLVGGLERLESISADETVKHNQRNQRHVGENASEELPQETEEPDALGGPLGLYHQFERFRPRTWHRSFPLRSAFRSPRRTSSLHFLSFLRICPLSYHYHRWISWPVAIALFLIRFINLLILRWNNVSRTSRIFCSKIAMFSRF